MSRQPIVFELGRHSAWISGPMGPIHLAIQRTGTPWMRCRLLGVPCIPLTHADDLIVYIEAILKRPIRVEQVSR
jgi:hypothetical protein